MGRAAMLEAIRAMPADDRLWLVQEICETIPDGDATPALRTKLDRRLAELRANTEIALTWEQVKSSVWRNLP